MREEERKQYQDCVDRHQRWMLLAHFLASILEEIGVDTSEYMQLPKDQIAGLLLARNKVQKKEIQEQ